MNPHTIMLLKHEPPYNNVVETCCNTRVYMNPHTIMLLKHEPPYNNVVETCCNTYNLLKILVLQNYT